MSDPGPPNERLVEADLAATTPSGWGPRLARLGRYLSDHVWAIASLVLAVGVLYAPALNYEFLNLDDPWYITNNNHIKSWHPLNLFRIMTEPVARNYAPLTIGTFLVEHTLWGLEPAGYHATNVLLHALNTVLVFALIRQLFQSSWTAWIVAALFAVHPMQVESVVWISSRKTLLSSTFTLLCGLCYLRPDRTGRDEAWGALWLILGLLSKASTVSVPPIVLAYDIFIRRRTIAESVVHQVIPGFLCILLINYTMTAQMSEIGGTSAHLVMNKLEIAGVDATLMFRYLALLAVPDRLCVYYDPPWRGITVMIAVSVVAWVGLGVFLWKKQEQYPQLAFALACWLWLLFPVMNFFPLTTLMNDRYMYLPCLAVFCTVVEAVRRGGEWISRSAGPSPEGAKRWAIPALAVCLFAVGAYSVAASRYLPVWQNPMTLWAYARIQTPSLTIVQRQWADALYGSGDVSGALAALQEILDQGHPSDGEKDLIGRLQKEWSVQRQ